MTQSWRHAMPARSIRCAIALLLGTLLLALAACSGSSDASRDADRAAEARALRAEGDGSLTIYNSYEIAGLDPIGTGTNWLFDWGIAENLLQVTDEGEITGWLAEKYEQTDARTWTITLHDDLSFQNGRPVDAAAVAKALNRQIQRSEAAQVYFDTATEVTAPSPTTVVITTPKPNAMVPAALAARDNSLQIYDVSVMEKADGDSAAVVGKGAYTGPYAITAWDPDNLELAPYGDYWNGKPPLSQVTVKVVPDEQARIAGVRSGEADMAFYPSTSAALELEGDPEASLVRSEYALQSLLMEMNLVDGVFTDESVRKAFLAAIDYDEIATGVGNGSFATARGLYPDVLPYAVDNQAHDLDAAKRLLDEAGWKDDGDGVRTKGGRDLAVRIITQAQGPETNDVAIAMQQQVADARFDLKIVNAEDSAAVKEDPKKWEASVALSGSLSGTADPLQPYQVRWVTGGSSNAQGLSDPEIDKIGARLRTEFDEEKRADLLRRAQKIIVDDHAYLAAATYKYFTVVVGPAWADYQVSSVRRHITIDTGAVG